ISADGLAAIAASADGALRDAEVSLTKIRTIIPAGPIGLEQVHQALGLITHSYHPEFLSALLQNDKPAALAMIHKIHDAGIDLDHFAKEFLAYARLVLIASVNPSTVAAIEGQSVVQELARFASVDQQKIIAIVKLFTAARGQIKTSPIPQLPLELAVMQL
ncbi:MAG TPA: hypothetical protein VG866_00765, partial [Candidatus Paceibacterota bacterium]|nr:hypothetical protein [Candidatus Paceibacterota bacterium]